MGFGKWLKGATRIRFDDRTLGNLLKNGAVAGGTALGGVGGLALAGLGSAAGQKALGGSWKDAAGAGIKGAGTATALHSGIGALKSMASRGAGAVPTAGMSATVPEAIPSAAGDTGGMLSALGATPVEHGSLYSAGAKALNVGGRALNFAEKHPNATSGALSAFGNLAGQSSENEQRDAQTDLLRQQADETRYDFDRRKARQSALSGAFTGVSALNPVSASPYSGGV